MKKVLFIFQILLLTSGCSDSSLKPLNEEEKKIAEAYAEILFLNQKYPSSKTDSLKILFSSGIDSVFMKYDLTRDDFENEFLRLSKSPSKFKALFNTAEEKLKELRQPLD